MTKSSKLPFNNYVLWVLAVLASLNLLVILTLIIFGLSSIFFLWQFKSGVTLSTKNFAQTGEIDVRPLPINNLLSVSDVLLRWKKWDLLERTSALLLFTKQLQTTDQRILLIFQGSDELRPTGGFMGAYGIATFKNGILTDLTFEDIYDAAGQMQTRYEPPRGVAEYTSGGEGWKLPDANWDPHFPKTAHTILEMMKDARKGEFTGVIAINTSVLKQLLEITGPVSLPEYQTTLSPDTVDELLSAHRREFFAGSRAKVIMLQQSFNKMLYSLASLSPKQQIATAKLLFNAFDAKSVQMWHSDPQIQDRLVTGKVAGTLPTSSFIALIEANVGINKINDQITRNIRLWRTDSKLHLQIEWHNTAAENALEPNVPNINPDRKSLVAPAPEADHNAYVNYNRIITSEEVLLASGSASELIIIKPGQKEMREFTFIVPITTQVTLWKQSGIDSTTLNLEKWARQISQPFLSDTVIP